MSSENYRSATKSHDPGWNDPPKLCYSPGTASGQTSKTNLNKRIAFPVMGASNQPSAPTSASHPQVMSPITSGTASSPSPSVIPLVPLKAIGSPPQTELGDKLNSDANEEKSTSIPTNEEMKGFVEQTLKELLLRTDTSRQIEIRKRLDVMLESWNAGKLSEGLVTKLYQLAHALKDRKTVGANEIHRSIIVEQGKECVQWAPALRQLIQTVPADVSGVEPKESIIKPL
ncbi:steroid receptor RNA activator 1-like [Armigeres subalbatus]|uniref:steroid receptor RNA activator 1-like n=1 Tax=Armigeres subalbatus TaxID=124917 RepID=UPI002ED5F499